MSGRLKVDPSATFRNVVLGHELSELGEEALKPLLYVNVAHVQMLRKQQIISEDTANRLIEALQRMDKEGLSVLDTEHSEDLYFAVEQKLIQELGMNEAGNIHVGRSRNDIYSTVYRMILREKLLNIQKDVLALADKVLRIAELQKETIMPGYTHTQHAQPITVGYYFLGVFDVLLRDVQRMKHAFAFVNKSPLGAAALTTTSFDLDRQVTSDCLGFDSIICNAYDAISGRDYTADVMSALNAIVSDISRVVTDLMTWNMFEFSFIEIPDEYAVISSIMPQKKNPAALEFLRSAASWVLGDTIGVLSSPKGVSYSDIRDATKYLYTPIWHSLEVTSHVVQLFGEILPNIQWHKERMLEVTNEGYSTMTDLADFLVQHYAITFRESHHIVALFVRESLNTSKKANEVRVEVLNQICHELGYTFTLTQQELMDVLDPRACLERRHVVGGTANEQIRGMLDENWKRFKDERRWYLEKCSELKKMEESIYEHSI
ncbi:argininosuccinate lyase [Pullulanibacillus camelliae]|uniref:Argininosuccinate lyase n=1 Tax=Pullulanibacillus camelliae TaxID=1707096 RepID=A0A8J3E111_9BACL|nr:argininosuccinate lyase [Pullulanibacillus camelliae]GGE55602.1 argininosuccinate lyase [Pullulanibacillus camelliae]